MLNFDVKMLGLVSKDRTVGACYASMRYAIYHSGAYIVLDAQRWLPP
jgi:hypothetical protein